MNPKLLASLVVLGLSAGAASASGASNVLNACIRGADLTPSAVETARGSADGVSYARVEAGGPVDEDLARAINACADRHGGNTTGPVTATLATSGHSASAASDTSNPRRRPPYYNNPDPFPLWRSSPQCNDTPSYIYRGNLYCVAGR